MKLPSHYWILQLYMIRMEPLLNWRNSWEPQAELIGQLTHPEIYKDYIKFKEKIKEKKDKNEPVDVSIKTEKGVASYSETKYRYDPNRGLVDADGNIIVPKEKFDKTMHLEQGINISY